MPALDALIAESEKGGRQFLKKFFGKITIPIYLLNEHTQDLTPLLTLPEDIIGLVSDAGLPCIADPGSQLVFLARKKGIKIEAYPGPSSILLALMLSGLPAQQFTFHGYLEREPALLHKQLISLQSHITHIFIETPYRNQKMLEAILKARKPKDLLCVAWDLMGPEQIVISQPIQDWKQLPNLQKKPAIFLICPS
jgi:16S rRNA (cytidine1402-2'-O)-methyltransferase